MTMKLSLLDYDHLSNIGHLCKALNLDTEAELRAVSALELSVDTRGGQTISHLGNVFPRLIHLRLSDSFLDSFRDLGTSLRCLQVLHLQCSGVTDLDGIGGLTGLTELYLAFNDISDLGPLALHDSLEVLDLDSNAVADVNQIDQLGTCFALRVLNLKCNPISTTILALATYRRIVAHHIPHLAVLDDELLDAEKCRPITPRELEDAMASCTVTPAGGHAAIAAALGALHLPGGALEEFRCSNMAKRSATACRSLPSSLTNGSQHQRCGTGALQILDEYTASCLAPATNAAHGVRSPLRSHTNGFGDVGVVERPILGCGVAPSSDLTHGEDAVVFAGNPVMAMRNRRTAKRPCVPRYTAAAPGAPECSLVYCGSGSTGEMRRGGDEMRVGNLRYPQQKPFNAWTAETIEKTRAAAISEELRQDIDTWRQEHKIATIDEEQQGANAALEGRVKRSRFGVERCKSILDELRIFNLDLDDAEAEAAEVEIALNSPCVGKALLAMEMRVESIAGPTTRDVPPSPCVSEREEAPRSSKDANALSDEELVQLLRQKPKHVPNLRTRQGYCRFFSAVPKPRMRHLLSVAYGNLTHKERRKKVSKRMSLLTNNTAS